MLIATENIFFGFVYCIFLALIVYWAMAAAKTRMTSRLGLAIWQLWLLPDGPDHLVGRNATSTVEKKIMLEKKSLKLLFL